LGIDTSRIDSDVGVLDDHVFDAVVAAYTGWLFPDGLEPPPDGFNVAAGWIWFPKTP
jgi:hypothetical protein